MAVKTITIDMAAYEALARRKRAGESFSDVIKAHFATGAGRDLLEAARRIRVAGDAVEHTAAAVRARRKHRAKAPAW